MHILWRPSSAKSSDVSWRRLGSQFGKRTRKLPEMEIKTFLLFETKLLIHFVFWKWVTLTQSHTMTPIDTSSHCNRLRRTKSGFLRLRTSCRRTVTRRWWSSRSAPAPGYRRLGSSLNQWGGGGITWNSVLWWELGVRIWASLRFEK